MARKFIKIKSLSGFHLIPVDVIRNVSPRKESDLNESEIHILESERVLYSTETQEQIYLKIVLDSEMMAALKLVISAIEGGTKNEDGSFNQRFGQAFLDHLNKTVQKNAE